MLELDSLSKTYGEFEFGPVDLTVGDEVLSVLGPSGSGKTTLLSLIAGIISPDRGSISLGATPLVGRSLQDRRIGLVFQDGALFPHMTARENVRYAATEEERIVDLAALLEITDILDRKPPTLSGGERQRVALARSLAANPDVLLLDEPLSSLDAPIQRRLRVELNELFESLDIPVIYVTHNQRTATALGDRTAVFRDGIVEQVGSPTELINRPANRFVARFTGNENLFDATVVERTGDTAILRTNDLTLRATAADIPADDVTACIHPSRVQLLVSNDSPNPEGKNIVSGIVDNWLNEGDGYRVAIILDEVSHKLIVTVRPPIFDQLAIQTGTSVRVAIPSDSIHCIR